MSKKDPVQTVLGGYYGILERCLRLGLLRNGGPREFPVCTSIAARLQIYLPNFLNWVELKFQWAVSGLSAANLYAPTLNTAPDPTIWIDANHTVTEIASLLGGEIVDKGANLQVWQSAGNFSLFNLAPWLGKGEPNIPVAPGMLNIVSEPRAYVETASLPGRAPDVAQNIRERLLKLHG